MDMNGARAVVLGATGGFGAEIARSLVAQGAVLAVHGRNTGRLQAISAEVGGHPVAGDLTEPGVPDAVMDEAAQALGGLDVVVMSAGAVAFGPVAELEEAVLRQVIELDLVAPILVARAATRHVGKDGVIAQVSAVVADQPMAGLAAYSAAKAGLTAFDTAFRREMRRAGVRVLDARPPHMETGLATRPLAGEPPGLGQGRDPREVADELVAVIGGSAELPDWID
ncbi:MAG: SDR family NAD(P)-dependent oxidoreductase [Miltoncostaeaceae bacterium]